MKHRLLLLIIYISLFFSVTGYKNVNENMILNSGFEEGTSSSAYFWNTEAWDSTIGKTVFKWDKIQTYSGSKSASIINSSPNDSRYTQVVKANKNSFYKISCFIKTENIGSEAKGANISIKGLTYTSQDIKGTSNGWKYIELYGKTNSTQSEFTVTLGLGGYGSLNTGKAWFDDVEIRELSNVPEDKKVIDLFDSKLDSGTSSGNKKSVLVWPLILLSLGVFLTAFLILKSRKYNEKSDKSKISNSDSNTLGLRIDKKDVIIFATMTLIYLGIALINLGSFNVPKTSWTSSRIGESFVIDLGNSVDLSRIYYYKGLGNGKFILEYLDSNGKYKPLANVETKDMFTWQYTLVSAKTNKIKVIVEKPGAVINEIGIFKSGSITPLLNIKIIDKDMDLKDKGLVENLIDEQKTIDYYHSFLTGTYFDEIYHARTAFEQLNLIEPFETTHPPLGKIFISIGIFIFGMNPFGWRIIGMLFGAAMIPLMYIFAKKMFSKRFYAFCAAFLMMFDFMHFVQTRIATIDVYGTFFIILMYYYMYDSFVNKSYEVGFKKSLKPLFLSGIFFGFGAASKWIALYGAGGLAILFFIAKGLEYRDFKLAKQKKMKENWTKSFIQNNIVMTMLWCILFFIIIPGMIYLLSFIPFMMVKGQNHGFSDIINYQANMFNYHNNLVADHFFKSKWYTWPLDYKPMWFYSGSDLRSGIASSITSMGNPAIWWLGAIAIPAAAVIAFIKRDKKMLVVFTAIAFQYLPWIFVSRIVFIYHFFSTVPFMILCIVYLFKYCIEKMPLVKYSIYFYLAIVLVLFLAFYPVLSGLEVSKFYIDNYLRWFKGSWYF